MRIESLILGAAALLLATQLPASAGSCSTPDLTTGEPFGGACSLTCGPDASAVQVSGQGLGMAVAMFCDDGFVTSCSTGSLLDPPNVLLCQRDDFDEWEEPEAVSCTCNSGVSDLPAGDLPGGVVLGASCSC